MRTRFTLRRALVAVGALTLAIPASAFALTAGHDKTKSALQPATLSVQPVAYRQIAPRIVIRSKGPMNVLAGQTIGVRGRLLPAQVGRHVALQGLDGRRWRTLAGAITGPRGGFAIRYVPNGVGPEKLRVRFANAWVHALAHAARLTVFQQSVASWYNDGGSTACGFHATMGVANKTLPCGTRVAFRHGGTTVTAVVDDRGPFVPGRDWDLNQNLAAALGVGGVDTVWSSR